MNLAIFRERKKDDLNGKRKKEDKLNVTTFRCAATPLEPLQLQQKQEGLF